jgi:hypothetical protein
MHDHVAFLPPMSAFFVVLVLGIIALIIAIVRENGPSGSGFWFYVAFWCTCLALLI